jgi:hypothetical protein
MTFTSPIFTELAVPQNALSTSPVPSRKQNVQNMAEFYSGPQVKRHSQTLCGDLRLKLIFALKSSVVVTKSICTKLTTAGQVFLRGSCTQFDENPTNHSAAITHTHTHTHTHTER